MSTPSTAHAANAANAMPSTATPLRDALKARGSVNNVDLSDPQRHVHEILPAFELLYNEVMRAFTTIFAGRTRLAVKMLSNKITYAPQPDIMKLLAADSTVFAPIDMSTSTTPGFLMVPGMMARQMLLASLGAGQPGAAPVASDDEVSKPFTRIDSAVLSRLFAPFVDILCHSLSQLLPLQMSLRRFDNDLRTIPLVPAHEVFLLAPITMEGILPGELQVVLPLGAFETLRERMAPRALAPKTNQNFTSRMQTELMQVELDLIAELGRTTLSVSSFLAMSVGDVLVLRTNENESLPIVVAGRVKLTGKPKMQGNAIALVCDDSLIPPTGLAAILAASEPPKDEKSKENKLARIPRSA